MIFDPVSHNLSEGMNKKKYVDFFHSGIKGGG